MRDYDQDIARSIERDGIRMASGQHISSPIPRHTDTDCGCWYGRRGNLLYPCDAHYVDKSELPDTDPWVDRNDHYDR